MAPLTMDSQEFATQTLRVGLALGLAGCHTGAQVDAVFAALGPMLRSALGTTQSAGAPELTAMVHEMAKMLPSGFSAGQCHEDGFAMLE